MEINFLKYLPQGKKPLKKRKNLSDDDRIKTWKLDYYYFDGSREQGYGGYKYDGRWKNLAKALIKNYKLNNNSRILDIGCAKGYLLKELKELLPKSKIYGVDISEYAISNGHKSIKHNLIIANADSLPFKKNFFDLTYENKKEKKILDEWAVLATTYMSKNSWLKFFKKVRYNGDYDWFKPR